MTEVTYIEFDDPDDPRSIKHPDHDGAIRFTIAPEGYILALPNGKLLSGDDQELFGKMLRFAYWQGKEVGAGRVEKQ